MGRNKKKKTTNFSWELQKTYGRLSGPSKEVMVEKPVMVKDKTNLVVRIRDEFPEKFLGTPAFKFTSFKSQKQRIEDAISESKYVSQLYQQPRVQFRTRQQDKEIQPQMRFTSDAVERVAKGLESMLKNSDNYRNTGRPLERLSDSMMEELSKNPGALKKYIAKTMFPDLHQRTHFKAVTSFYLDLPDSLQDKTDPRRRKKSQDDSLEHSQDRIPYDDASPSKARRLNRDIGSQDSIQENFPPIRTSMFKMVETNKRMSVRSQSTQHLRAKWLDPVELSREVLKKCRFVQNKKETVPVLRKGDGINSSNPDRTMREIYDELFPRSIDAEIRTSRK